MKQRLMELDQQQEAIMLNLQKASYAKEAILLKELNDVLLKKNIIYKQQLENIKNEKV